MRALSFVYMFLVIRRPKMADMLKKLNSRQSEFSHQYACWARNHRGWAKMKRFNRKQSRCKIKRMMDKEDIT